MDSDEYLAQGLFSSLVINSGCFLILFMAMTFIFACFGISIGSLIVFTPLPSDLSFNIITGSISAAPILAIPAAILIMHLSSKSYKRKKLIDKADPEPE